LEGRLVSSQRPQFGVQLFQHGMREAGADVAHIAPLRAIAQGYNQGAKVFAGASRCGETDYHDLLALARLDLEPVLAAYVVLEFKAEKPRERIRSRT
jgi:hypothetical protein